MSGKKHSKKPVQVERIDGFAIRPKLGFNAKYPPSWSFGGTPEAAWYNHCGRIMTLRPEYEAQGFVAVPVSILYFTDRCKQPNGTTCPKCSVRFGWRKNYLAHLPCNPS